MAKKPEPKKYRSKKRIILVDEFGDYGKSYTMKNNKNQSTRYVGMGISVLKKDEDFLRIRKNYCNKRGFHDNKELKGCKIKNPKDRKELIDAIKNTNAHTYGFNLDKTQKEFPKCWTNAKSKRDKALCILEKSMERVLDKKQVTDARVIIDYHDAYKNPDYKDKKGKPIKNGELAIEVVKKVADKKGIKVNPSVHSSSGKKPEAHLLQINDIVSNSVYNHLEKGDKKDVQRLGTKLRKIKR